MARKFNLTIRADDAAFDDDAGAEIARILRDAATALERGTRGAPLHDSNGNQVGRYDLSAGKGR